MAIIEDKTTRANASKPLHNIIVENREKISISGVEDVESFDEENIVLHTQMGVLSLKGTDLHINKFNVETGELVIEGEIDELIYSDSDGYGKKRGLFSKMFG